MDIKNYFHLQQQHGLTSREKFLLYEDIMQQCTHRQTKRINFKKFTIKAGVTITVVGILFVSLYQTFLRNTFHDGIVLRNAGDIQQTYANTIGQILYAKGIFTVTNQGKTSITNDITDGGIVTIGKDSSITVQINSGISSTIVGPATFSVNKVINNNQEIYRINMMEGNYITISSNSNDNVELTTPSGLTVNEVIDTNHIEGKTNFVVLMQNDEPTIINKGVTKLSVRNTNFSGNTSSSTDTSITDTTSFSNHKPHTFITQPSNKQTIIQTQDIAKVNTKEKTVEIVKNDDITLSSDQRQTYQEISALIQEYEQKTETTSGTNIANNHASIASKTGEILNTSTHSPTLTTDQIIQLRQNTHITFVKKDLENIATYYLLGEKDPLIISYKNLTDRYQRIATILNIKINPSIDSLQGMYDLTVSILAAIQTYPHTMEITNSLVTLKNRLFVLKGVKQGKLQNMVTGSMHRTRTFPSFEEVIANTTIDPSTSYLQW